MKRISLLTGLLLGTVYLLFSGSLGAVENPIKNIKPDQPNIISVAPTEATFLRVRILDFEGMDAPCIDELEVYSDENDNPVNLAISTSDNPVTPTASSLYPNYPAHQIEHINDGKYGNAFSWIPAADDNNAWIQLQWEKPVHFNQVVFSRDRNGQFTDRVPTLLEVSASNDGENWTVIGSFRGKTNLTSIANYFSSWMQVPAGNPVDLALVPVNPNSHESLYDQQLKKAILGEENAWLKVTGFADCVTGLISHGYPEHVDPKTPEEDILPIVTVTDPSPRLMNADAARQNVEHFWQYASRGAVRVCRMDSWETGGLVEQTVAAVFSNDSLYLEISGNRFMSDNIAMVSTDNYPARGFIQYSDNKLYWVPIDKPEKVVTDSKVPLDGTFDAQTLTFRVSIPRVFLPYSDELGIYVALGFGGNNTQGGHPVHFIPAGFAVQSLGIDTENQFCLTVSASDAGDVKLTDRPELKNAKGLKLKTSGVVFGEGLTLAKNETRTLKLPPVQGIIGPEFHLAFEDENGREFQWTLFEYDPCYRALSLLREMLIRRITDNPDEAENYFFNKNIEIPGTVNPLYTDIEKTLVELKEKYGYFDKMEIVPAEIDDAFLRGIAEEYGQLQKEHAQLQTQKHSGNTSAAEYLTAQRNLFLKTRLLKRRLFLTDDALEPLTQVLFNKRHPFLPTHNYSDLWDSKWNPGGAVCIMTIPFNNEGRLEPENAKVQEIIQAGEGIIRNPSPSYDTKKIYYAHRVSQDEYFRIMEFDRETGSIRRISPDGPFHDFWPTLLPDNTLAFVTTRCTKRYLCWEPQAFTLHKMNLDGTNIKVLSHANLTEFAPSVKDDGRILWTRSEYVDKGADYGHTLWTIRIDGTMPELVFGNTINLPQGYANGRDVPETREVCTIMISHFGDLNGPVSLLNSLKGPHDPSANHCITPEIPWPGYWDSKETFREPFPISKNIILVAHAPQGRFGLFLIDRFGNRELLSMDENIDSVCPQPFQEREVPPVLLGTSNPQLAEQGLGRFSVANVYRGLEEQVRPGAAKYLRVCQEMPATLEPFRNADGSYPPGQKPFEDYYASPTHIIQGAFGWPSFVAKGVFGTVEIEEDGSVDFLAPAGKVLFFSLLDENYNEIQRMRSVIQLQPGEQRSCIGCHESRLSAPEGGLTLASQHQSKPLVAPPWGAGPFWFEKAVQPVLDKNCVSCHDDKTMAQNPRQFDLRHAPDDNKIPASYRSLITSGDIHYFDYTWGRGKTTKADPYTFGTHQSKLWDVLKDDNHKSVSLTSEEEQAIKCWTDLNVPLWGDYSYRPDRK